MMLLILIDTFGESLKVIQTANYNGEEGKELKAKACIAPSFYISK